MKRTFIKYFLTGLLFSIFQFTQGQSYFQIGYNGAFLMGYDSLNYIFNRYNETRASLDVQMENIKQLNGLTFSFGKCSKNFFWDIGYSGAGNKTFAEGKDISNIVKRRIIKVKSRMFDFDLGYRLNNSSSLKVMIGTSFSMGSFVVKSKLAVPEKIKDENWEKINDESTLIFASVFFVRIAFHKGIFVQPYFMFSPGKIFTNDVTSVKKK